MEIIPSSSRQITVVGLHKTTVGDAAHTAHRQNLPPQSFDNGRLQTDDCKLTTVSRVDWTTWWLWRGACTRSHPELGREIPQRPWYCVLRHGRVGRRQVLQSTQIHPRGVEQPGSSSGS